MDPAGNCAATARPVAIFGFGLMAVLAFDTLYLMPTAARTMRDLVRRSNAHPDR